MASTTAELSDLMAASKPTSEEEFPPLKDLLFRRKDDTSLDPKRAAHPAPESISTDSETDAVLPSIKKIIARPHKPIPAESEPSSPSPKASTRRLHQRKKLIVDEASEGEESSNETVDDIDDFIDDTLGGSDDEPVKKAKAGKRRQSSPEWDSLPESPTPAVPPKKTKARPAVPATETAVASSSGADRRASPARVKAKQIRSDEALAKMLHDRLDSSGFYKALPREHQRMYRKEVFRQIIREEELKMDVSPISLTTPPAGQPTPAPHVAQPTQEQPTPPVALPRVAPPRRSRWTARTTALTMSFDGIRNIDCFLEEAGYVCNAMEPEFRSEWDFIQGNVSGQKMVYSYSTANPDKTWPLILIGKLGQYPHVTEAFAFANAPTQLDFSLQLFIDNLQMAALCRILENTELSGTIPNPIVAKVPVSTVRSRMQADQLGSLGVEFPYLFDGNLVDMDVAPPIWADYQMNPAFARDFLPDRMVAVQVELSTYNYMQAGKPPSVGAKFLLKRAWTLDEAVLPVAVPYTPRRKTKNWTPGMSPSKRTDGFAESSTSPTKKTRHN